MPSCLIMLENMKGPNSVWPMPSKSKNISWWVFQFALQNFIWNVWGCAWKRVRFIQNAHITNVSSVHTCTGTLCTVLGTLLLNFTESHRVEPTWCHLCSLVRILVSTEQQAQLVCHTVQWDNIVCYLTGVSCSLTCHGINRKWLPSSSQPHHPPLMMRLVCLLGCCLCQWLLSVISKSFISSTDCNHYYLQALKYFLEAEESKQTSCQHSTHECSTCTSCQTYIFT